MSLYVEIGFPKDAALDVPAMRRSGCSRDLEREGVMTGQRLVAEHSVVHRSRVRPHHARVARRAHAPGGASARPHGVYSIGRYGGWTYCSIEDNIVEARALVATWK